MNNIIRKIKKEDVGSIGIGAMIVFIAMVLVAGIAASVLIQTSTKLESQAMSTGSETIGEVAGGLAVFDVEGQVATDIEGLAITIRPRAGSPKIDLNHSIIILSDSSKKVVLRYDYADAANHFNSSVDTTNGRVFGFYYRALENDQYAIVVVEDPDSSVTSLTPVINSGDKVMLFVDTIACFGGTGIGERTDVFGYVYPEHGSPGVINFKSPSSYSDVVYDLQ